MITYPKMTVTHPPRCTFGVDCPGNTEWIPRLYVFAHDPKGPPDAQIDLPMGICKEHILATSIENLFSDAEIYSLVTGALEDIELDPLDVPCAHIRFFHRMTGIPMQESAAC